MFQDLYRMFNRAIRLDDNAAFRASVTSDVKKLIVHLNTVIQLGQFGIDSEGHSLGEYAPFTIDVRTSLGLQVDHIDFKVTGDYWGSWKVIVKGDTIEINVNASKFNELVQDLKFSGTHVGLTDENIAILSAKMLPAYRKYAIDKIFKC